MRFWRKKRQEPQDSEVFMAKCGHRTASQGEITACDDTTTMTMQRNGEGSFDYCLDCIAAMTIRCAWCGSAIFISSPITLYQLPEGMNTPESAVKYGEHPLRLVGCLGWDCASTGADRAGFWVPNKDGEGQVRRVQTAFEMIMNDSQTSVVMVRDLSDPNEHPYMA